MFLKEKLKMILAKDKHNLSNVQPKKSKVVTHDSWVGFVFNLLSHLLITDF
jgi:hypothetical protein